MLLMSFTFFQKEVQSIFNHSTILKIYNIRFVRMQKNKKNTVLTVKLISLTCTSSVLHLPNSLISCISGAVATAGSSTAPNSSAMVALKMEKDKQCTHSCVSPSPFYVKLILVYLNKQNNICWLCQNMPTANAIIIANYCAFKALKRPPCYILPKKLYDNCDNYN